MKNSNPTVDVKVTRLAQRIIFEREDSDWKERQKKRGCTADLLIEVIECCPGFAEAAGITEEELEEALKRLQSAANRPS